MAITRTVQAEISTYASSASIAIVLNPDGTVNPTDSRFRVSYVRANTAEGRTRQEGLSEVEKSLEDAIAVEPNAATILLGLFDAFNPDA